MNFNCVTLQFGDGEESDSDSETWLHQNTSDIVPSISPSSIGAPSAKAMDMITEELCQWLKDIKIDVMYIECFRGEDIDGSVLAVCDDSDLKDIGISEPRIRKKIMVNFRKIMEDTVETGDPFVEVNKTKEESKVYVFNQKCISIILQCYLHHLVT